LPEHDLIRVDVIESGKQLLGRPAITALDGRQDLRYIAHGDH